MENDSHYWQRRAEEQREFAEQTSDLAVAAIHQRLAELYALRAKEPPRSVEDNRIPFAS